MTEENNEQQVTIEEALQMYERRLQEQTGIIFALVAKQGGKVTLTQEDLTAMSEYNTVSANDGENNSIELVLMHEDRGNE